MLIVEFVRKNCRAARRMKPAHIIRIKLLALFGTKRYFLV